MTGPRSFSALVASFLVATALYAVPQQAAAPQAAKPAVQPVAKVADLGFLAGHWEGGAENTQLENTCSLSDPHVMMCMFRMRENGETEQVEFLTMRDTPDGVIEQIRFFSPDLSETPGTKPTTMRLVSFSPEKAVFENPSGTYPLRNTMVIASPIYFTSYIELIDQGKHSTIEAQWHKVH